MTVRAWYAERVPPGCDYFAVIDRLDAAGIPWRLFVNALPGGRAVVTISRQWTAYRPARRSRWVFDAATGSLLTPSQSGPLRR